MKSFARQPGEDPMNVLCRMAAQTTYEDIPGDVLSFAKKQILDIIGVSMGGSGMDGIADVVDYVQEQGGKPESYIPFYGYQVPAAMAAFATAPMARAMDMGDTHEEAGHGAEYTVPTLLAACGLKPKVTGREFLTAFVVAQELMIRTAFGYRFKSEQQPRGSAGGHYIFGAVAAVAKLLGWSGGELMNAIGIAKLMTQPHDTSMYSEGSLMIRFHHGFVAQDAINVCMLAKRGITGPSRNVLTGQQGYYAHFARNGAVIDFDSVTRDLGTHWEMTRTSLKAHAACKCTHTGIDAVRSQVKKHGFTVSDVESAHFALGSLNWYTVAVPEVDKWAPETVPQCQFSLPYALSVVMHEGGIFLDAYTNEARKRADVRGFMRRITASLDESLPPLGTRVTTRLKNGKEFVETCTMEKGHPDNPMTVEDVVAKFHRCVPFAAKPLPSAAITRVIDNVLKLETISDCVIDVILPLVPESTSRPIRVAGAATS